MKIISSFKDSYDSFQDYQSDIVYKRFPKKEEFKISYNPFSNFSFAQFSINIFTIGFCGRVYPAAEVNAGYAENKIHKFFYDPKTCKKYLIGNSTEKVYNDQVNYLNRFEYYIDRFDPSRFEQFFEESPIFKMYESDIWTNKEDKKKIEYNVSLQDIQFYQVIDPYSVYQELDKWTTNKAIPIKPIPEISNKDKITLAGFDLKTSFRKGK